MIIDPFVIFKNFSLTFFIKIVTLILIGLYAIFSFMLATKIRSFNKILFLPPRSGGKLMQTLAIIYFLAVLSLFLITLVIV